MSSKISRRLNREGNSGTGGTSCVFGGSMSEGGSARVLCGVMMPTDRDEISQNST